MRLLAGPDRSLARSCMIGIAIALVCLGCALAAVCDNDAAPPRSAEAAPFHQVSVLADGNTVGLSTSASTVRALLAQLGLELGPLDRTNAPLNAPLADGMEIRISRVSRRQIVEELVIPAKTVVLAEPDLPVGFTKILTHGNDGLVRRLWRVWEKDGEETSRGVVREEVLAQAKDTVVLRGAQDSPTRGGNWRRPLVMTATAYDPGPRSCGKHADGYTATGVKAQKGVVAVDDRVIPMGTRMYIPGYGFAVAADRGSAIKGMRIDLCYNTYAEAKQFGRRKVKVYLLD
ncbi:MAG: 3D domain-containing protein [Armatimonadota bacterium]